MSVVIFLTLVSLVILPFIQVTYYLVDHSGELLFKKPIVIDGQTLYLEVRKNFDIHVSGKDYYTYKCWLYTDRLYSPSSVVHTYKTYWLDYFQYRGNIDKVVNEAIRSYTNNLSEQRYIKEKEREFMD